MSQRSLPAKVQAADVRQPLDEALVAFPGRLLFLPLVRPGAVRHDGYRPEGIADLVFGQPAGEAVQHVHY
jgi:hypothetical protein